MDNLIITEKKTTTNFSKLIAVSLGHFINDFYMNIIPPILFLFASSMSLNLTQQGMIAFVITSCGAFAQPVIGHFVDKHNKTYLLIFSVLWIAFWMSISGFINNYYILLIVVGFGALASALYHPLGTAAAVKLGNKSRGKSLSIFMTIGGFAASVAPICTIPVVKKYGLSKLIYFLVPGIIIAILMYILQVHKIELKNNKTIKEEQDGNLEFSTIKWVSAMIFISTNKTFIYRSLLTFGIQILLLKNIDVKLAGYILSSYLFLNAAGTITGGYLNDKFGSKRIIILCNIMAAVCILMITLGSGIISIIGFVFLGFCFSTSNTSNIVLTQDLIPENANMGTGLIMGFAGGLGGLGILLFGKLADKLNLITTTLLVLIPLSLAIVTAIMLPHNNSSSNKSA